jgi:hypothetical protein
MNGLPLAVVVGGLVCPDGGTLDGQMGFCWLFCGGTDVVGCSSSCDALLKDRIFRSCMLFTVDELGFWAMGGWQDRQVRLSKDLKNDAHDPAALFTSLISIIDVIFFAPASSCRVAKGKRWTSVRVRASRNGACNGTISDIVLSSR